MIGLYIIHKYFKSKTYTIKYTYENQSYMGLYIV